jgi:peptidoglycan-associated lipoprotein
LCTLALIALTLASTGCCGGKDKGSLETARAAAGDENGDELPNVNLDKLILCGDGLLKPVYFDYDSAALTPPTTMTLGYNAGHILDVPKVVVQIAGHCDERGTQEYNLALGEKRAQAVRNHLRQLGVPGDRLVTMSYGEEQPAIHGSDEVAWSQNRRCEFWRAPLN